MQQLLEIELELDEQTDYIVGNTLTGTGTGTSSGSGIGIGGIGNGRYGSGSSSNGGMDGELGGLIGLGGLGYRDDDICNEIEDQIDQIDGTDRNDGTDNRVNMGNNSSNTATPSPMKSILRDSSNINHTNNTHISTNTLNMTNSNSNSNCNPTAAVRSTKRVLFLNRIHTSINEKSSSINNINGGNGGINGGINGGNGGINGGNGGNGVNGVNSVGRSPVSVDEDYLLGDRPLEKTHRPLEKVPIVPNSPPPPPPPIHTYNSNTHSNTHSNMNTIKYPNSPFLSPTTPFPNLSDPNPDPDPNPRPNTITNTNTNPNTYIPNPLTVSNIEYINVGSETHTSPSEVGSMGSVPPFSGSFDPEKDPLIPEISGNMNMNIVRDVDVDEIDELDLDNYMQRTEKRTQELKKLVFLLNRSPECV